MEQLKQILTDYKNAGCPMVSHSVQYRAAYRPAYRVAREQDFDGI